MWSGSVINSCNKASWVNVTQVHMVSQECTVSLYISVRVLNVFQESCSIPSADLFLLTAHVNQHTTKKTNACLFTHSPHHKKLTAPFLLLPVTLNLFKHVIHAYPCDSVISPPYGSVHSPIHNIFPDPAVQHRGISTVCKNWGRTHACWWHIPWPMCFSFYLSS